MAYFFLFCQRYLLIYIVSNTNYQFIDIMLTFSNYTTYLIMFFHAVFFIKLQLSIISHLTQSNMCQLHQVINLANYFLKISKDQLKIKLKYKYSI